MNQMFAAMLAAANAKLPYKRQLAYLESTGTQYIDTGIMPDLAKGDSVRVHYYKPDTLSAHCALGTRATGVRNGFYVSGNNIVIAVSNTYIAYSNSTPGDIEMSIVNGSFTVNGTTTSTITGSTAQYALVLFALNTAGTISNYFPGMRLYEYKYYRNGTLAQHLIPVLDWNDVPCMYDKVSKQLFYNQGTGQFKYWPVEEPIDGEYGVFLKEGATVISSGMEMTGVTVNSGQTQYIYNRGVAAACIISGGTQYVSAGGTAAGCIGSTGQAHVSAGGLIDGFTGIAGACYVSVGASARDLDFHVGYGGAVYSTGVVNGIVLSGNNARITVFSGGTAYNATASAGGRLFISGYLSGATVNANGSLTVYSGGTALAVTSNAGAVIVVSDGGHIEYA